MFIIIAYLHIKPKKKTKKEKEKTLELTPPTDLPTNILHYITCIKGSWVPFLFHISSLTQHLPIIANP